MKKKTATPILITGYQYGDHGHFIGTYQFEKNLDKKEIHLPPRTTLTPPPPNLPADRKAFFENNNWTVRNTDLPGLPDRELPANEKETGHGN